jgi:predicted DNA-binding transcriptional regulator YafY
MRTERLFRLLDELRGRRHAVSAQVLAETLGVTMRTIYRDIATLQGMGAPIRGEGGVGYQLEKGYFLPPLHFDDNELDALIIGLRLAAARGDHGLGTSANSVLAKIEAVLSGGSHSTDRPLLAPGGVETKASLSALEPLRKALRKRRKILLGYEDLKGQISERVVRPLGLTVFEKVWLLTGWCEMKDGFRNFRVDRVSTLRPLEERFRDEPGKRFSDYLSSL